MERKRNPGQPGRLEAMRGLRHLLASNRVIGGKNSDIVGQQLSIGCRMDR
jgi:hypothetical protein